MYDPVPAPASLPCLARRLQRRFPRAVPVGVRMEQWVHFRFHSPFHYHLCYPIRYGWDSQLSFSSVCFWYLHHAHRWWKVAARRHSIPDFVEVLFQSLFKVGYLFFVYPCRSFIRFYSLIRFQDPFPLTTKCLLLTHLPLSLSFVSCH